MEDRLKLNSDQCLWCGYDARGLEGARWYGEAVKRRYLVSQLLDIEPHVIGHVQEDARNQEDYNRVLEDINATLRKNRGHGKEEKKMHKESSKGTLDLKKSESRPNVEVMRRSTSRTTMDQIPVIINPPPKSPSRLHLETR